MSDHGLRALSSPRAQRGVLAIVGSISLAGNAAAQRAIEDAFNRHDPRGFVSGGALGIDTMAALEAKRRSCHTTVYLPGWTADYAEKIGRQVERIPIEDFGEDHP